MSSAPSRSPAPSRDRRLVRLALAAGAITVAVGLAIEPRQPARGEERYVIPPGTAARALAGESIEDVLPQTVQTAVGRPLIVENRDTTRHTFGPFALEPGQSWRRTFATAGDVQIACSLYPSTGFTIAVAPPPVPAVRSTVLLAAWLALLTLAAAAAVGGVGVAIGVPADVGSTARLGATSGATSGTPADASARAWRAAGTALALLLPFSAAVVALAALRLSRTAAWADIAVSRTTWLWALSLGPAAAAAWCGQRLAIGTRVGGSIGSAAASAIGTYGFAGSGLALVTLGLAWTPFVGLGGGLNAALATAGAGLLVAALIARNSGGDGAGAERRLVWTVALPGAVLLGVALPAGAATPPVQALLAAPKLAAALGLAWLARAVVRRGESATAPVLTVASTLAALWSFGQLYGALLGHLNAVTLPKYGNPVPPSTASAARGAALWAAECAACHAPGDAAAYGALPDAALFEAITFGQRAPGRSTPPMTSGQASAGAMPAFKYRLDVFQRGDIVNYVRAVDIGESSDP
ncbi:MAG: c-type cytochrome [Ardenticatenales bacterium]|nr:c-type cytochrome [Ardenticatenales bacterium]